MSRIKQGELELVIDGYESVSLPIDSFEPDLVGVQVSADGTRLWVCIDGQSVLRVKGCKNKIKVEKLK